MMALFVDPEYDVRVTEDPVGNSTRSGDPAGPPANQAPSASATTLG